MSLTSKHHVLSQLTQLGVTPHKTRGQNFAITSAVTDAVLAQGFDARAEHVVEIGPGLGALTAELLKSCSTLTVIEVQPEFCQFLRKTFPNLNVIDQDVRLIDWSRFPSPLTVIGNLPYSLSSEILFAVAEVPSVQRAIFLLQKEFVERMASPPGSKVYGILSVMIQIPFEVRKGRVVSPECFYPIPEIESQVVELKRRAVPFCDPSEHPWIRRVVKAAFGQRRKMLKNTLRSLTLPDECIAKALATCSIEPTQRAETVSVESFVALARELKRTE